MSLKSLGDDTRTKAREYALDRLSLSLVLQACGRGIRNKDDRYAFGLLDRRYDDYDWRPFLEPKPYNVREVDQSTLAFYQKPRTSPGTWDPALSPLITRLLV